MENSQFFARTSWGTLRSKDNGESPHWLSRNCQCDVNLLQRHEMNQRCVTTSLYYRVILLAPSSRCRRSPSFHQVTSVPACALDTSLCTSCPFTLEASEMRNHNLFTIFLQLSDKCAPLSVVKYSSLSARYY